MSIILVWAVWKQMQETLAQIVRGSGGKKDVLRVVRTQTDDGQSIIGLSVPDGTQDILADFLASYALDSQDQAMRDPTNAGHIRYDQ